MRQVHLWLRAHPQLFDGLAVALVGVIALLSLPLFLAVAGLAGLSCAFLGLLFPVPLVFRTGHPAGALYATIGLSLFTILVCPVPPPAGLAGALFVTYAANAYAARRHAYTALLAVILLGALAALHWGWVIGEGLGVDSGASSVPSHVIVTGIATTLCWTPLLIVWFWGGMVSARHAYLQEALDRVSHLEREREALARLAVVEERGRIAREMHDVVAHSLSVVVLQADGARHVLEKDPERAAAALENISRTGRQATAEMRRLLGVLRDRTGAGAPGAGAAPNDAGTGVPPDGRGSGDRRVPPSPVDGAHLDGRGGDLTPQPGLDRLDDLFTRLRDAGLPLTTRVTGEPASAPAGIALSAYRIAQEALTNALRHAGAGASAEVRIDVRPDGIAVEVLDDGRGVAAPDDGAGHGLIGMRERAAAVGGLLTVGPRPGGGFAVTAWLPYTHPATVTRPPPSVDPVSAGSLVAGPPRAEPGGSP